MIKCMTLFRVFVVLFAIEMSVGCAAIEKLTQPLMPQQPKPPCADLKIDEAFTLYNEAKTGLAIFYEDRDDNRLYQAYYASLDSVITSREVKKCWDRAKTHQYAMQNLNTLNRTLRRIILINLPDADPGYLIAIYRDQYHKIMNK